MQFNKNKIYKDYLEIQTKILQNLKPLNTFSNVDTVFQKHVFVNFSTSLVVTYYQMVKSTKN